MIVAVCFLAQAQTAVRLYPVDDTAREPAFRSYVGKLRSAVNKRDTAALRKLVDTDVFVGPEDDDKGWTKFVSRWRPDERADSPLWSALSDLLSLGFVQEHPGMFLSPYVVWRFPRSLNMAAHLVVVRDKVAMREAPSIRARSNSDLSFDIVQQLGPPQGGDDLVQWVHVRTLDGKSGYLSTRDVMSPLMPRAQFGLRKGRWLLMALEAPDQE